jgi:type I restriction enzyme S subunit
VSRIHDLIAGHYPEGIEFTTLGQVASYSNSRVDASELDATNFVGVDNLLSNKRGRSDAFHLPNTARVTAYKAGDVLIGNIRPYLKKVWLADRDGGCSGDVLAVRIDASHRSSIDCEFLYYLLSSDEFFAFNTQHARGAKMPRGSKEAILDYRIPVPPTAIQREIVGMLDKMRDLQAALAMELELRSSQYSYYRDLLLSFPDRDVPWIPMRDLGKFIRGKRFTKADYSAHGVGCIHYGEIYTHYGTSANSVVSHLPPELAPRLRFAETGDVVIVDVGETVDDVGKAVAWLGSEPVAIHDHTYAFRHRMNPTFVAYVMQTPAFRAQKARFVARTKVNTLLIDGFSKIAIPVPPLEEQERIVRILDKFDALVNDQAVGLPAEIKTRCQQYEYYRDRLLSFEDRVA